MNPVAEDPISIDAAHSPVERLRMNGRWTYAAWVRLSQRLYPRTSWEKWDDLEPEVQDRWTFAAISLPNFGSSLEQFSKEIFLRVADSEGVKLGLREKIRELKAEVKDLRCALYLKKLKQDKPIAEALNHFPRVNVVGNMHSIHFPLEYDDVMAHKPGDPFEDPARILIPEPEEVSQ